MDVFVNVGWTDGGKCVEVPVEAHGEQTIDRKP